jgi:Ca2+-transporting ATPase
MFINNEWYQRAVSEVTESLGTETSGLTSDEAKARLAKYGYNELEFKGRGYVLLVAAAVTAILGMWIDAAVILAVVLANAIIGFIQEGRAEASMEAVTRMMVPKCTVLRDNKQEDIPSRELVPGDIVILEEGDRVPADLRLFYTRNLSTDEAALTGESVAVEKITEAIPKPNLPPGDQRCIAFSSTYVARGSARGIVVATGEQTEIGKIARLIKETPRVTSAPLIRKIAQFTRLLVIVVLILAAVNFLVGITLGGDELAFSFLASVSLAVAAIPEGLPAILTIALALGARAMAKRNALIRRLPAVETLGSATVICSDKTGTLTKNEMTVVQIYCGGNNYKVSGVGYQPEGEFFIGGHQVNPTKDGDLIEILQAGLLCNNASLEQHNAGYQISGDPTEGALLVAALKADIKYPLTRLDEIPFESQTQYMATLHASEDWNIVVVKGSPEKVVAMCQNQLVNGHVEAIAGDELLDRANEMATDALRVLGFAYKLVPTGEKTLSQEDLRDLIFLGFQGMIDPPKEEAIEAVNKCRRAGIKVKMVTGDHPRTAVAIARQLGIEAESGVLTGEDLSRMSDEELYNIVDRISVFARVAPIHKFRVVTQLQKRGHIVAVTGDGVNDAPAIKAAELGIAMGAKGTDVAKEASDMVLVDDNFATIVTAVEEGRHTFENIRKVILYTIPTNGGQALIIMGALLLMPFIPLFGLRLPLEPIQILWINLYDAVVLALPLLWEPREKGLLDKPPRDPKEPIANSLFFRKVGLVSLVMAGAAFLVFYYYGLPALSGTELDELRIAQAQTAAFMTVMMVHIFYLLTARSLTKSVFTINPFSNKRVVLGITITIVLHLLIVYVLPGIGFNPFRVEPFPQQWWIAIVSLGSLGLLIPELEEYIVERWKRRP